MVSCERVLLVVVIIATKQGKIGIKHDCVVLAGLPVMAGRDGVVAEVAVSQGHGDSRLR